MLHELGRRERNTAGRCHNRAQQVDDRGVIAKQTRRPARLIGADFCHLCPQRQHLAQDRGQQPGIGHCRRDGQGNGARRRQRPAAHRAVRARHPGSRTCDTNHDPFWASAANSARATRGGPPLPGRRCRRRWADVRTKARRQTRDAIRHGLNTNDRHLLAPPMFRANRRSPRIEFCAPIPVAFKRGRSRQGVD